MTDPGRSRTPLNLGALWRDERARGLILQAVTLVLVGWFVWFIVDNTARNLAERGIASGFGFLGAKSGFAIVQHLIDYDEGDTYGDAFLVALLNTLLVSSIALVLATVMGLIVGLARLSTNWLVAKLALAYVEIFRNLPLLLVLFAIYFVALRGLPVPRASWRLGDLIVLNNRGLFLARPDFEPAAWWILAALALAVALSAVLIRRARARQIAEGVQTPVGLYALALILGLPLVAAILTDMPWHLDRPVLRGFNFAGGMVVIPEFVAVTLGLSLYTAAFIAEIVRAGIQSVSFGQTEAAAALGLRAGLRMRLILVPQAMRVIIPPLTTEYLNLVKNSSLGAAIAYPELVHTFAGTVLNQTGQAIEVILITMAVYLTLSMIIAGLMNRLNARARLIER